ncbi:MAG: RlpA-like double-psi beta-barrel domain-containing protein [Patescibacteria group bacterium]|nr:RlpA-like double-psi beta-barrel domain-containing protein [Patescibacteria group bacterium]
MYRKNRIIIFILSLSLFIFSGFIFIPLANSEDALDVNGAVTNQPYHIHLDQATIVKGYTVSAFNNELKLSLTPGILSQTTDVDVELINEEMDMPWQLDRISKIYEFEFSNKSAYDNHQPFYIQFSYDKPNSYYKQVYFYDASEDYLAWRPLPTKDYPGGLFVRSLIHLPYARIAVFVNPDVMTVGRSSWYGYKNGNFAASPNFPKGSRLRVHNNDNGKFVDVKINDYGPDRKKHPDRVIDLDKTAFAQLAPIWQGMINVHIEPLYIAPEFGKVLGITEAKAGSAPEVTAESAIVINEQTGKILWQKNANATLPIASLTKLVAVKVFLDTRPSMDRVVAYSVQDEEYNYQYCDKSESARLRVNDGETMTIENLLYASLAGSANNAVETLARVSGLSRNNFIKQMNKLTADWGANSTYFVEPTGLSPKNISSAADYAIISKEVFKHPIIQKASTITEYKFFTINTKKFHRIRNTNKLIKTNHFNITGSKTGYLNEAGYCLITRSKANNHEQIIAITLGANTRNASFTETKELLKYGLRHVTHNMEHETN